MNQSRRGGVLIRLVAIIVVVGTAGILSWGALNNQRVTGKWSFHPLDPAWWSPKTADGKTVPATEVVDDARVISDQVGQALWGQGGLIDRVEKWWKENDQHTSAAPTNEVEQQETTAPVPGSQQNGTNGQSQKEDGTAVHVPPAAPTSVRGMLEQRLQQADATFQAGLADLKAASPVAGDEKLSTVDRVARVGAARSRFIAVERDLAETIPAYEAIPQHDAKTVATARQLRAFNKQMLEMTGGVP